MNTLNMVSFQFFLYLFITKKFFYKFWYKQMCLALYIVNLQETIMSAHFRKWAIAHTLGWTPVAEFAIHIDSH